MFIRRKCQKDNILGNLKRCQKIFAISLYVYFRPGLKLAAIGTCIDIWSPLLLVLVELTTLSFKWSSLKNAVCDMVIISIGTLAMGMPLGTRLIVGLRSCYDLLSSPLALYYVYCLKFPNVVDWIRRWAHDSHLLVSKCLYHPALECRWDLLI